LHEKEEEKEEFLRNSLMNFRLLSNTTTIPSMLRSKCGSSITIELTVINGWDIERYNRRM
jgi:hypothetical protein